MSVPVPNIKCLNPMRIINPYTHEAMSVPCGKCSACLNSKNSRGSFLCDLEAMSHKYCLFVTLTYSDAFVPRLTVVPASNTLFGYEAVTSDGEVIHRFETSYRQMSKLLDKIRSYNTIPYLSRTDVQLFLKRLRYYVSKRFPTEKVRYYAVGEYGPVHFRPHYHILLYFSSDSLYEEMATYVHQAWQFGIVDCQLSQGKCSQYVAGYVNSNCNLPEIYQAYSLRPFCLHSQKLGQGILSLQRQVVYQQTPAEFTRRCLAINGQFTEFTLWRSCYAYFYPKCKGFASKSTRELSFTYTLYSIVRKTFPHATSVLEMATLVARDVVAFRRGTIVREYFDSCYFDVLRYFNDASVDEFTDETLLNNFYMRVYSELLLSKHFLYFVCDVPTVYEIQRKIKLIRNFYSYIDYANLVTFFESQQMYYESDLVGDDDLSLDAQGNQFCPYFYDNVDYTRSVYFASPAYKAFSLEASHYFNEHVKHKRLNDYNKLLFND